MHRSFYRTMGQLCVTVIIKLLSAPRSPSPTLEVLGKRRAARSALMVVVGAKSHVFRDLCQRRIDYGSVSTAYVFSPSSKPVPAAHASPPSVLLDLSQSLTPLTFFNAIIVRSRSEHRLHVVPSPQPGALNGLLGRCSRSGSTRLLAMGLFLSSSRQAWLL